MIRLPFLFLIVFSFFLFSCQGEVSCFQFTADTGSIELREKPGRSPSEEGKLFPEDDKLQSPVYYLREPVTVEKERTAFSLIYAISGDPVFLILFNGRKNEPAIYTLPANNGRKTEIRVPLDVGTTITAFQVYSEDNGGEGELFQAGLDTVLPGIRFLSDRIVQGSTVEFTNEGEIILPSRPDGVLMLNYLVQEEPAIALAVSDTATGEKKTLRLKPSGNGDTLYLYQEYLGFIPNRISINTKMPDFKLLSAVMGRKGGENELAPLPADLSTILNFDQSGWRSADFELFSWNAYPEILIFDTADYSIQASFFKRIAFFVEKEGYTGTLMTNEELAGKHGWNAHDYRAEDLADFFLAADESGFLLNQEELQLKDILLRNGILTTNGRDVAAGEGGLIAISRASSGYLRRKFIIHEGTHGIFFTDPLYRDLCFSLWEELPAEGKAFWKLFLAWNNYQGEDRYLRVNEYQAYMLQQSVGESEHYFRSHGAVGWILHNREPGEGAVRFISENPGIFEKSAMDIEEAFHAASGFRAGDLFCMEQAE